MWVKTLFPLAASAAIACAIPAHAQTSQQQTAPAAAKTTAAATPAEKPVKVAAAQTQSAAAQTQSAAASTQSDAAPSTVAVTSTKPKAKKKAKAKRAGPRLSAHINLSSQTMTVKVGGVTKHVMKISSGKRGYRTPTGNYRPQWMTKMHYSKKYNNSPMPHSVFYSGGFAIHATYATGRLGAPASHGCIRLSPSNAKKFYYLVQRYGKSNTRISIRGVAPKGRVYAKKKKRYRAKKKVAYGYGYGAYGYTAKPAKKRVRRVKRKAYVATKRKPRRVAQKKTYAYGYAQKKYAWPGD